jgi:hypothetical protein
LTIVLGIRLAAGTYQGWLAKLGSLAAYGVISAAVLDGLENLGQAEQLLNDRITMTVTTLVGICASLKFLLLLLGILFGLFAWLLPKKY